MKLSVITINRNNSEGLRRTIESVSNQTFKDFEYLIIDGASTDESIKVIEEHNKHFFYWVSEPDTGIYNAMNKGIKKANGEYCLFLSSGDYLLNDTVLEDVFSLNPTQDIVYGSILMSDGVRFIYPDESEITFSYFLKGTLPHPCSFIKTSLFTKIGLYDEDLKIVSDWKFFLLATCKFNVKIKKVDLIIAVFDLNGISSTPGNKDLILNERNSTLENHFPFFLADYYRLEKNEKQLTFIKSNLIIRGILKSQKLLNKLRGKRSNDQFPTYS
jgi:glycosyltransferase involved in cell wall biosynthesis